jgi:hypothetical protein
MVGCSFGWLVMEWIIRAMVVTWQVSGDKTIQQGQEAQTINNEQAEVLQG